MGKREELRIRAERLGVNIEIRGKNRTITTDKHGNIWPRKHETHAVAHVTKLGRRKEAE